jgi:hypothetical protein
MRQFSIQRVNAYVWRVRMYTSKNGLELVCTRNCETEALMAVNRLMNTFDDADKTEFRKVGY